MKTTAEEWANVRKLAEKAAKGRWEAGYVHPNQTHHSEIVVQDESISGLTYIAPDVVRYDDAVYIAHMNPDFILRLLADVEKFSCPTRKTALEGYTAIPDLLIRINQLEAENQRLRERIECLRSVIECDSWFDGERLRTCAEIQRIPLCESCQVLSGD